MDNQIDNSFRSFIARRGSANVGRQQIANGGFLKKYYHSSWNHNGLHPEVTQQISEHLYLLSNGFDQSQKNELRAQIDAENNPKK